MSAAFEAFFLAADQGRAGQRFCIFHPAQSLAPRGAVLYVHPFAEEMNKSRRMAALQSRALAASGFAVLQIDLYGCGDSSGDFGDVSWEDWLADVMQAMRWLQRRADDAPLWLWGLRAGALIAAEAAQRAGSAANFLFWQPAISGKVLVQQFLRLKAAGALADGSAKAVMEATRAEIAAGRPIHVAGYQVPAPLLVGLEAAALNPPATAGGRVVWLEVATRADASLSPGSLTAIERWERNGFEVHGAVVPGPPFWQTTEIEDAPALVTTSKSLMLEPTIA